MAIPALTIHQSAATMPLARQTIVASNVHAVIRLIVLTSAAARIPLQEAMILHATSLHKTVALIRTVRSQTHAVLIVDQVVAIVAQVAQVQALALVVEVILLQEAEAILEADNKRSTSG
jgi:hypothetical protein